MTSVLNVDSIAAKDGTSPVELTKQSAAKAWVAANNDATLNDSQNISSGTDNGSGNYTYNFSSAMSNANYSVVLTCEVSGVPVFTANLGSKSTSAYNAEHGYTSTAPAYVTVDLDNYSAIHGDLA